MTEKKPETVIFGKFLYKPDPQYGGLHLFKADDKAGEAAVDDRLRRACPPIELLQAYGMMLDVSPDSNTEMTDELKTKLEAHMKECQWCKAIAGIFIRGSAKNKNVN